MLSVCHPIPSGTKTYINERLALQNLMVPQQLQNARVQGPRLRARERGELYTKMLPTRRNDTLSDPRKILELAHFARLLMPCYKPVHSNINLVLKTCSINKRFGKARYRRRRRYTFVKIQDVLSIITLISFQPSCSNMIHRNKVSIDTLRSEKLFPTRKSSVFLARCGYSLTPPYTITGLPTINPESVSQTIPTPTLMS